MKIIVCVKQVPDTSGKAAVKADGTLDRASMETITNPDDMSALEVALRLKEQYGCKVCVISMGPLAAEEMLREMLAMGADEAVLVSSREFGGSDTYATSQILAAALSEYGCDVETLILCGKQAIDGDTAQVGPQIAEKLGLAQITCVSEIMWNGKALRCRQEMDGADRIVRVSLPCLLTCVKEMNKPRYMSVPGIMSAYDKRVAVYDYEKLKEHVLLQEDTIGLKGSPTNIYKSFTLKQSEKVTVMAAADREGCSQVIGEMVDKFIISKGV